MSRQEIPIASLPSYEVGSLDSPSYSMKGLEPTFQYKLNYDHTQRWGLVNTPSRSDAVQVTNKAHNAFPFVASGAIVEILEHVFDNVANHGVHGSRAKGDVVVGIRGNTLIFRVSNTSDSSLPNSLNGKEIGVSAGIMRLDSSERHSQRTGGGNGLEFITRALPYVYTQRISTSESPSVFWSQSEKESNGRREITFELRIPIPTEEELQPLLGHLARQEFVTTTVDHANKFFESTKNKQLTGQMRTTGISIARGVLQLILEGSERESEKQIVFVTDVTACQFLEKLGPYAAEAAPDLRSCIINNVCSYPAVSALAAVEKDPTQSLAFFSAALPHLLTQDEKTRGYSVDAIVSYGEALGPKAKVLGDVLFDLMGGKAAKALTKIGVKVEWGSRIADQIGSKDPDEAKGAIQLIKASPSISSEIARKVIPHLGGASAYEVSDALAGYTPTTDDIPLIVPMLKISEKSLHYPLGFAARIPNSGAILFESLIPLLTHEQHGYGAGQLLQNAQLTETQKNRIGDLVFDTLQDTPLSNNILYRLKEILIKTGLPDGFAERLKKTARDFESSRKTLPYTARELLAQC